VIIAVSSILIFPQPVNSDEILECLDSEPTVVKISGKIYEKVFPGPPNYESVEKGDRRENYWILKLDAPVCVAITSQEESWIKFIKKDIKEIMLVLRGDMHKKFGHLMQKRVFVTGTLWEAHTAHHRTPVLITVEDIYPEEAVSP